MTLNSTNTTNSPPNFRDGRLQPGIYKLQNIYTETYLDIEVHSREVVCRPIKDLGEGRGLVRGSLTSAVHESDNYKWEIKPFGVGYTVQRVSFSTSFVTRMLNDVECSLTQEDPSNFVPR